MPLFVDIEVVAESISKLSCIAVWFELVRLYSCKSVVLGNSSPYWSDHVLLCSCTLLVAVRVSTCSNPTQCHSLIYRRPWLVDGTASVWPVLSGAFLLALPMFALRLSVQLMAVICCSFVCSFGLSTTWSGWLPDWSQCPASHCQIDWLTQLCPSYVSVTLPTTSSLIHSFSALETGVSLSVLGCTPCCQNVLILVHFT